MRMSGKARLFASTASAACAIVLTHAPAAAQCVASTATVDCTGTATTGDANAAIATVTGANVTVRVASGATVTGNNTSISLGSPPFSGAIDVGNAGTLGATGAPVGIFYSGPNDGTAANTFAFSNSGTISGRVQAYGVGGAITATNSGTIGGGLILYGGGDITLTSSGPISGDVSLASYLQTTATAAGVTNVTETGGITSATITAPVAIPAAGAVAAVPQSIYISGIDGGRLTLDALAGNVSVYAGGTNTAIGGTSTTATSGTTTTTTATSVYSQTAVGGGASATLGSNAVVANLDVDSAAGTAAASIAGQVGSAVAPGGVTVSAGDTNSDDQSKTVTTATPTTTTTAFTSTSSSTDVGGAASVDLAATGKVFGWVGASAKADTATVTIAGTVGAAGTPGGVNATSDGTASVNTTANNNNLTTGDNSGSAKYTQTMLGKAASVTVASTGKVFGSVGASSNAGAATVTIAGSVGNGSGTNVTTLGDVFATSTGTNITMTSASGYTAATGDNTNTSETSRAATGQTASVTVASTGAVFGSVNATGDAAAAVDNAGRIRNDVNVTSARGITVAQHSAGSQATTTGAGGATTIVSASSSDSTTSTTGGTAAFQNRAGGVVEDNVNVNGLGGATLANAGAIFGNVTLASTGTTGISASGSTTTTTTTPAVGGGATTRQEIATTSSSSSTPTGGSVSGDYSGTVGAVAGSLAGYRTVNQNGQGGSSATIGGTMFADFSSNAGGAATTSSSGNTNVVTTQPAVIPATAAIETTNVFTSRDTTTQIVADNSVTVTGALRNNGYGTGDLTMSTGSGKATLLVNGGAVDGGVSVYAGGASNSKTGTDVSTRSTVAATAAGPVAPTIDQSYVSSSFTETGSAAGTSAVTLTKATIGGNVTVYGAGSGAGSSAASLNVSADSKIGGSVSVFAGAAANERKDTVDTRTRTGAKATTRVYSEKTVQTAPTQAGGDATLTLAGQAGTATVSSDFGNASATLTGNVVGAATVTTGTTLASTTSETRYAGTDTSGLFGTQTGYTYSSSTTNVGGVASLAVASNALLQAAGTPAVSTNVTVFGIGGSTLTNAAGSRLGGGAIFVGTDVYGTIPNDLTSSYEGTAFTTTGVQTGWTTTSTAKQVGGAASLTNAGIIDAAATTVQSIGGATVANTGRINGTVTARSLGVDSTSTTTVTGNNDAVIRVATTTTTNSGRGGAAAVSNSGTITDKVSVFGATGAVTNGGVMRGGIALGEAVAASTKTVTTATSMTTTLSAPATPTSQTYNVSQNGLLTGGIYVGGAMVADTSTGAAPSAQLQTSNVTATLNLTGSSVTLGDITAEQTLTGARTTNTTLNLTGNGFLGVGPNVSPSGVGTASTQSFASAPNYAAFLAIDPTLGKVSGTAFVPVVPPVPLPTIGSRIRGVTLVEKSGAGSFTIVGAPYIAHPASSPSPTYTMDVGTFRISGGEVQLGVSGTDPATGASIFGIKGNVEIAGGTLVLGRRVTDGTTTVLQGANVLVNGNLTQSSTGTTVLAATPALIRQNSSQVVTTAAPSSLGFAGYGVKLEPFVAYDPLKATALHSTPSSLTVTGNVSLSGTVAVATTPGAIYTAGRNMDLMTVSGTFAQTNLTLAPGFSSPFVKFALSSRASGGATIVSLDVARTAYNTVTTTTNSAAAANALEGSLPNVVSGLAAVPDLSKIVDVQAYGRLQDLATVISGLDTQLTAADATKAFTQLGSGSVYGSLAAVATTAAFGEVVDGVGTDKEGLGLWLRPMGRFARFDGDSASGASTLRADTYGGAIGFNIATGNGGNFGIGGGYGRTDAREADMPAEAHANTYMIGLYAAQRIDRLDLSAQAVFGWSNWRTSRTLPMFARTATATFDSKEFRFDARVGYDFDLGGAVLAPFARVDIRRYSFGAFGEEGAGGIGLAVAKQDKTVFSPELGLRIGGTIAGVQPYVEGGYVFQGNVEGYRTVSYLGDPATSFRLQGVDPDGYGKLSAGIQANAYGARFMLRGSYLTGGGNSTTELTGGVSLAF